MMRGNNLWSENVNQPCYGGKDKDAVIELTKRKRKVMKKFIQILETYEWKTDLPKGVWECVDVDFDSFTGKYCVVVSEETVNRSKQKQVLWRE